MKTIKTTISVLLAVCGTSTMFMYLEMMNSMLYSKSSSFPMKYAIIPRKHSKSNGTRYRMDILGNFDDDNRHLKKDAIGRCPRIVVQNEKLSIIAVHSYKDIFVPNGIGLKRSVEKCCKGKKLSDTSVYIRLTQDGYTMGDYDAQVFWLSEQWGSPFYWDYSKGYLNHVKNSKYVWGSKLFEKEWFEMSLRKTSMRPFDYVPFFLTLDWQMYNISVHPGLTMEEKTIDFLMFGQNNTRRSVIVQKANKAGLNFVFPNGGLWGNGYFELLANVKVVVNVHFYQRAILEVHRINPLLALGHTVVSEKSRDTNLDEEYKDVVHFTDYDNIVPLLVRIKDSWEPTKSKNGQNRIKTPFKNTSITKSLIRDPYKGTLSSRPLYMKNPLEQVWKLKNKIKRHLTAFCRTLESLT